MYWIVEHLLLATVLMVVLALAVVLGIFWLLPRVYRHESRPQFASAAASVLVAVLFSVILNNWYALKRDKDNRLRVLRDQHFAQLRPVLRAEAVKLREVATQMAAEAHISKVGKYDGLRNVPSSLIWPEVMSQDLSQHFADYEKSKRNLLAQIESQDQEFRVALAVTEDRVKPTPGLVPSWKEIASISFVEQCLGHGDGFKLTTTGSGYSVSYLGGSSSASGGPPPPKPTPDLIAAYRAFQSLKPDPRLNSYCESLRLRAGAIQRSAEDLARNALRLSEGTILKGTCDFTKSDSLPD